MQMYRRVLGPETVEPIFGKQHDLGREIEKAAFVGLDGRLEVWYAEDFRRNYKSIDEKKPQRSQCDACGDRLGQEWAALDGRVLCVRCARRIVPKSPHDFHACYLCVRCGKTIDEDERFVVTCATCNGPPGRERVVVCMSCWVAAPDRCVGCGKKIGLETACRKKDACGWLCRDCWNACQEAKKPKPLTLADLTPGDVFRYRTDVVEGHLRCDEKHQMLASWEDTPGSRRTFYCAGTKEFFVDNPTSPVERLAHHTLTPKQLLWIDTTPEERKALEDSIRDKWLPIMRGEKQGRKSIDCALCRLANSVICKDNCILARGSSRGCGSQGYNEAAENVCGSSSYSLARTFTMELAAHLPQIHLLRIEVEATPVEWPGAKK